MSTQKFLAAMWGSPEVPVPSLQTVLGNVALSLTTAHKTAR